MGDNFPSKQPETAAVGDTDEASGSGNMELNYMKTRSTFIVLNRKRKESNDREMPENIQTLKECRQEIYGLSDQNLSSNSKLMSKNSNFMPEKNVQSSCIASDRNEINFKGSQSCNQGTQALDLSYKNRPSVIVQNFPSKIGILQSAENSNAISILTDSGLSIKESAHSKEDILAVPGPSGLSRKGSVQNVGVEEIQSSNPSEVQPVMLQDNKVFVCRICNKESNEHVGEQKGKKIYCCCICGYEANSGANLQMHNDIHCPQKRCTICENEYAEGNLHESEQTCIVCEVVFPCKILLDHHSAVEHKKHFNSHCWVCRKDFNEHSTIHEGNKTYICCVCETVSTRYKNSFTIHNNTHRPKLFCGICKEQYAEKEKSLHKIKIECECIVCKVKFKCKTQLEDHSQLEDHKTHFLTYCRACNTKIEGDNHKNENVGDALYKCCKCSEKKTFSSKWNLQTHLYTHTGLRFFKCDVCGKRFVQREGILYHAKTCLPLPETCKICRARFPSTASLEEHRSKKHEVTQC